LKYNQIDVMPTFHPSYLLREESAKAAAWADLQLVMKRLDLQRPR
jgi:DNA polymerase